MSEGATPPVPKARSAKQTERTPADLGPSESSWGLRLFDGVLIGFFLALAFLLGVFRLKDVDYYWHLRTGDLIRETGRIPRIDFYTFTRAGTPWIDLHWVFQVCISWLHEHGGVPLVTLAKCLVTCVALFLLITARRKTWPVWAMILAWLPALLVLSGRMYIRPETLTLLYLSIFLAVLCRWERRPWLTWILPVAQVAWVNSHGLFILGPVVLGFALLDAALRPGALSPERRRWWSAVIPACGVTALACLLNPYGIYGALYPLELAGTMGSPIFSERIAELNSIPFFMKNSAGLRSVPLQIHFFTLALGALSFIIPIMASGAARLRSGAVEPAPAPDAKAGRGKAAKGSKATKGRKAKVKADAFVDRDDRWRISLLRLLLFAAFSILSFQATRNSHQFATVVGTVTAWNFAEWIGSRRVRDGAQGLATSAAAGVRPRVVTLVALILLTFGVASGLFYAWTGEGRVIGWGEEPLWFPHESARFAGEPGMPDRFLSYHNGHASLFIYYNSPEQPGGPGKTVYTDPRLEVTGLDLFQRYEQLRQMIETNQGNWLGYLDDIGRPSVLVDHEFNTRIGASLAGVDHWRCVRFDDVSAVFVHDSFKEVVEAHEVDFAARHFRPKSDEEPQGPAALLVSSKAMRNYAGFLADRGRMDRARPFVWLGLDYARRIVSTDPDSLEGWKSLGYTEMLREPMLPSARCTVPFDPLYDLSPARATYALRRASSLAPRDFLTLVLLTQTFEGRNMLDSLVPVIDRLLALNTINEEQVKMQAGSSKKREQLATVLAEPVPTSWKNLDELDRLVDHELKIGRVEAAVGLLESAYPPGRGNWEAVERISTLLLHLGRPERAREFLEKAVDGPRPAVRDARLAVCDFVEGRFADARGLLLKSIEKDPDLFEARYVLAVLEQDDAHAAEAYAQAIAASQVAPGDVARSAVQAIAASVRRFAGL